MLVVPSMDYSASVIAGGGKVGGASVDELGKDEFLLLLLAQLKNQDPLEPMENTEFISQLAQLRTLEQIQELTTLFSMDQAAALIGKNVRATTGSGDVVEGCVNSVRLEDGEVILVLDDGEVRLSDVVEVGP